MKKKKIVWIEFIKDFDIGLDTYLKGDVFYFPEEESNKLIKKKICRKTMKRKTNFKEKRKEISKYDKKAKKLSNQINKEAWLNNKKPKIENFLVLNNKGKLVVSVPLVTKYILYNHNFKTIFGYKGELIYCYDEGIYKPLGKEIIKTEVERILDYKCSTYYVNEIFEKIKRKTKVSKEDFESVPINLICLENGIFNIKTNLLEEHNPKYYFKTKLPIEYDKKGECKKFLKFLSETLYLEDIEVIQEYFGFALYRKYFLKKAIIFKGETDTGKTVLINIFIEFVGEKNKSGLSLQKIASNDSFALMSMKNKFLNVYDDLSSKDLYDGGGFKIATGGGYISGEIKFGDHDEFLNYAKLLFATNKIPPVKDNDDPAYFSRWIIIQFDNIPKIQDPFLSEKLTTKKSLSGIFNWAMEGLKRILDTNKFSYSKNVDEIKEIMERSGSPLSAFAQDVLINKNEARITKQQMYEIYTIYCNQENKPKLGKEQLGRKLEQYAPYLVAKGGKERYWENVSLNECFLKKEEFKKILNRGKEKDSKKQVLKKQVKLTHKTDTLDTFSKTLGRESIPIKKEGKNSYKSVDIISKKVSKPSSEIEEIMSEFEEEKE